VNDGALVAYIKHSVRTSEEVVARLREAAAKHKFGILHVDDLRDRK
jgi:hypothetical protein